MNWVAPLTWRAEMRARLPQGRSKSKQATMKQKFTTEDTEEHRASQSWCPLCAPPCPLWWDALSHSLVVRFRHAILKVAKCLLLPSQAEPWSQADRT